MITTLNLKAGVVIALGGGGMRGVAHLGVLAELDDAGLPISAMAGTSSGALMGTLWQTLGSQGALQRLAEFCRSKYATSFPDLIGQTPQPGLKGQLKRVKQAATILRVLAGGPLMKIDQLVERVGFFLPDIAIESLRLPTIVTATDTVSGDEVWLRQGSLRLAVTASSAMPGLVRPVDWDGRRLQDGGAVAEIPVVAARSFGPKVLAVEVSEAMPATDEHGDSVPRALFRASAMGWQALRRRILADADAVIAPNVNDFHWADFRGVDHAVEEGRKAARRFLDSGEITKLGL